eukprot:gnl/TRDRNA2_/TRDRNA2_71867_c0_seq1.p2 gnl/TRDRNA2_/TRDRNA2_71867_c0~~gnl/TRDRNA2_/TRDRNA2_71867_c0_seq1.p2  ORF type:complete len:171 (-),score=34.26 gnl/TRDRNA2_/TRDRNA2_71867_c0_seq1:356-868(-)
MAARASVATLYDVLGTPQTASGDDIRAAFKRCALALHPDKPGGSKEAFQEVHLAFETLSDQRSREKYDALLKTRCSCLSHTGYNEHRSQHELPPRLGEYIIGFGNEKSAPRASQRKAAARKPAQAPPLRSRVPTAASAVRGSERGGQGDLLTKLAAGAAPDAFDALGELL